VEIGAKSAGYPARRSAVGASVRSSGQEADGRRHEILCHGQDELVDAPSVELDTDSPVLRGGGLGEALAQPPIAGVHEELVADLGILERH
jgi:hypothetical protein